jgi:hypothetical protein
MTKETSEPDNEITSLFHYTTGAGLQGILTSNCLWATHYRHLNDAHEGETGWNFLKNDILKPLINKYADDKNFHAHDLEAERKSILENYIKYRKETYPKYFKGHYITSFCMHKNKETIKNGLLSQWRAYGQKDGYCIEFDFITLKNLLNSMYANKAYVANNVFYGLSIQSLTQTQLNIIEDSIKLFILSYINQGTNNSYHVDSLISDLSITMSIISMTKHSGFKEENEFRISVSDPIEKISAGTLKHYHREQNGRLIPYIKLFEHPEEVNFQLPIKRIIVGPHPEAERRKHALDEILYDRTFNGNPIKVDVSEIPFIG